MADIAALNRTGLSAQANKVYDEFSKVDDDAKWLSAHKNDANIKDELVTKAPEIQQNWKNFQGDVASLQNSEDPTDREAAILLNGAAVNEWAGGSQNEGSDIHAILKPMTASIQAGDPAATGIWKSFISTIDQGNASLLHLQQDVSQNPGLANTVGLDQVGITASNPLAPVAGGSVSAADISSQAAHIRASYPVYHSPNGTEFDNPDGTA